ncbi:MAG: hypothetical protein JO043_07580 [Candidatus Eremiobacteraeota bacterium]|nr:hypothetical protein [Candidatus Eremiobacteraeota bacterium]
MTAITLGLAMPAIAASVAVPAGTKVTMKLVQSISSSTATAGQTFTAEAAAAVEVGGQTVVSKGAAGRGRVVNVNKAQGKSAGTMTVVFTRVRAVDGTWIDLTDSSNQSQGNAEKGKASTATIATTIALGPLGLFAHNMVKGKDITISPDSVFPAWVKRNVSVQTP